MNSSTRKRERVREISVARSPSPARSSGDIWHHGPRKMAPAPHTASAFPPHSLSAGCPLLRSSTTIRGLDEPESVAHAGKRKRKKEKKKSDVSQISQDKGPRPPWAAKDQRRLASDRRDMGGRGADDGHDSRHDEDDEEFRRSTPKHRRAMGSADQPNVCFDPLSGRSLITDWLLPRLPDQGLASPRCSSAL